MPSLTWLENALVAPCSGRPRDTRGWYLDGGVYDAEGAFVPAARHRGERAQHVAPAALRRDDLPVTPGRFLFGGWLQRHFGHLVITLGRLWAIPELARQLDGVVFLRLPDNHFVEPARSPLRVPMVEEILGCLGIGPRLPARIVAAPTRFAQLAMPDQLLLGHRESSEADDAAYVAMLRRMRDAPRVRHGLVLPRLYVSRSRLGEGFGRFLFEDMLEENLAAEGYAILHPECLGIAEQVAIYAAARQVVFAESSAIHLALGQLDPDRPVGIVARRTPVAASLTSQLAAAGLRRVTVVDALRGGVVALDRGRVTRNGTFSGLTLPDFDALRAQLVEAGLCSGMGWRMPTEAEVAARIAEAIALRQRTNPNREVRFVDAAELAAVA